MSRRLLPALLLLLLVPATAAQAGIKTFRSPSGQLGCMYYNDPDVPASVRCEWAGGNDRAVVVERTGHGKRIRITDTVMDPSARVLPYGKARRFGPIRCTSRRTGITCKNRARHGFTVSVQSQKVF
jgi:hypothetical protein